MVAKLFQINSIPRWSSPTVWDYDTIFINAIIPRGAFRPMFNPDWVLRSFQCFENAFIFRIQYFFASFITKTSVALIMLFVSKIKLE